VDHSTVSGCYEAAERRRGGTAAEQGFVADWSRPPEDSPDRAAGKPTAADHSFAVDWAPHAPPASSPAAGNP
jgi:hypothetical protein